ncbi:MAG: carbon storage regulator CsrA [Thermoguttaceae bacterium]|nr:carbon storage regulator CsrA [Thermoguttaceae bacterium]
MLVLSRKVGERILIGDNIAITVVRVAQGSVRLGVEAPENLNVVREEVVIPIPSTEEEKEELPKTKSKTSKRK